MTRKDARDYMTDMRFQLLEKYRQLSELKQHFELDESDIFNVLTSHVVLLYLDDTAIPIFEAYEAFELEDVEAIVYGSQAEIEAIAQANGQSATDADLSCSVETGDIQISTPEDDYSGFGDGFVSDSD